MDEIETIVFCPLGKTCIEVKDNKIHKCVWYHKFYKEEKEENGCAISWLPVLVLENTHIQQSTTAAIESFRNATIDANTKSQELLLGAAHLLGK